VFDTRIFDGERWQNVFLEPTFPPANAAGSRLARLGDDVVYVDQTGVPRRFSGTSWDVVGPAGPSDAVGVNSAVFTSRGRLFVAGVGLQASQPGGTWEFDGASWSLVDDTSGPGGSFRLVAAEGGDGRVIAYRSLDASTWRFDPDESPPWTLLSPSTSPGVSNPGLAFHAGRGTFLRFAGDLGDETWELVGDEWRLLDVVEAPPPGDAPTVVSLGDTVMSFAGLVRVIGTSPATSWGLDDDDARPGVAFDVSLSSTGRGSAGAQGVQAMTITAVAGGSGVGPDGVALFAWVGDRFVPLAANDAPSTTPASVAARIEDPAILVRLPAGAGDAIHVALAPRGGGDDGAPAAIVLDDIDVTVEYRAP
jgi:hypothetical protein